MQRYRLSYQTPKSGLVQFVGLGEGAVGQIVAAQRELGSTDFEAVPEDPRPGERYAVWGEDIHGRFCVVARKRG